MFPLYQLMFGTRLKQNWAPKIPALRKLQYKIIIIFYLPTNLLSQIKLMFEQKLGEDLKFNL